MMRAARPLGALFLLLIAACPGEQRILDARSDEAARIADLWWVMLAGAAAVCVLVTVLLIAASMRAVRRRRSGEAGGVRGAWMVAAGGVALPVAVIFPLLLFNYRVGNEVLPPAHRMPDDVVRIEVIGHKFWWEVRYPELGIVTANELHIPAGEQVRVELMAPDVIHSFWVPQLHGKLDMIPGRRNTIWLHAREPGLFRGQCAEFCGTSHALMVIWVEALPPEDFARWVEVQRERRVAATGDADAGQTVFVQADCHQCHAVPGLPLDPRVGQPGPVLTDFAARRYIGAGTLPNNRANLAAWIIDPERIKPGVRMPSSPDLGADRLAALLDYLGSLR